MRKNWKFDRFRAIINILRLEAEGRTVRYAENSNIKIESEKTYKTMYIYADERQNSAYVYIVLSYY